MAEYIQELNRLDRHDRILTSHREEIETIFQELKIFEKRREDDDSAISSARKIIKEQAECSSRLQQEYKSKQQILEKENEALKAECQKLRDTVDQLAFQVQELQSSISRRCNICRSDFIPLRSHHFQCKDCLTSKSTISCKKCKKFFLQKHHTHKHCTSCSK